MAGQVLVGSGFTNYKTVYDPDGPGVTPFTQTGPLAGTVSLATKHAYLDNGLYLIYLPPGTRTLSIGFLTYINPPDTDPSTWVPNKAAGKFGSPPTSTAAQINAGNSVTETTKTLQRLLAGEELKFFSPVNSGVLSISEGDPSMPPSTTGGYFYLNVLETPGAKIGNLQIFIDVEENRYRSWYSTAIWNADNNPSTTGSGPNPSPDINQYRALVGASQYTNYKTYYAPTSANVGKSGSNLLLNTNHGTTDINSTAGFKVKIFIPPGTQRWSVSCQTFLSSTEAKAAARFRQTPTSTASQVTQSSAIVDTQLTLDKLVAGEEVRFYAPGNAQGLAISTPGSTTTSEVTNNGYIYLNFLSLPGNTLISLQTSVEVDEAIYTRWYQSAAWDGAGNPSDAGPGSDIGTGAPAGSVFGGDGDPVGGTGGSGGSGGAGWNVSNKLGLIDPTYPPRDYPLSPNFSYVYNNWSSTTPGVGLTVPERYYHEYAWITGWPGRYEWQSKELPNPAKRKKIEDPQQAYYPDEDGDSYAAAYFPRPDMVGFNQPWRVRDLGKIEFDEYFRYGFIGTIARQAYYEFWSDYVYRGEDWPQRRNNQYQEWVKSFQQHASYQSQSNQKIFSFENTKTFTKGTYSNINDLTTSDVAGVNLAFKDFGNDLINLGKTLDLSNIDTFGLPSKFLVNLQKVGALTEALKLALLYSDLTINELNDVLLPTYSPSVVQENKIYNSLLLIKGQDLSDIKLIANCYTAGLDTLADLLNPKKMFPVSYSSITVPQYSADTLSSKIYDFIYVNGGVNARIKNYGTYLTGILPNDIAKACGAFMVSMNQIKNIKQMNNPTFSKVVANLEVTNKGIGLVNSNDGVPGSVSAATKAQDAVSLGSGSSGSYRYCDFMGAMSGLPYIDYYKKVKPLILRLQTPALASIYKTLYDLSVSGLYTSAQIQGLIDQANAEIKRIQGANAGVVQELNYWWNKIGQQLFIEQRAIPFSIPKNDSVYKDAGKQDIDAFVRSIEEYALQTEPYEIAPVLEAVSDLGTLGGQSIVAAMREARNARRLLNTGGETNNDVPDGHLGFTTQRAAIDEFGSVVEISPFGSCGGYDPQIPPEVVVVPQDGTFGAGSQNATGVHQGNTAPSVFRGDLFSSPDIFYVKVGWTTIFGTVTNVSQTGMFEYSITVPGANFQFNQSYTFTSPAAVPGNGATAVANLDSLGNVASVTVTNGGTGYQVPPTVVIRCPPPDPVNPNPPPPGYYGDLPDDPSDPVPPPLVSPGPGSYNPDEAIIEVTICNCECWKD